MKKYGRLVVLAVVTSLGPALFWLGGGSGRVPMLGIITACTFMLGLVLAMMPGAYPWEDEE
jgi:hypothetical protein